MVQKYRRAQEEIMQQAQRQIATEPEATRDIKKEILVEARDKIEQPAGRAVSPLSPIKGRINELLGKEEIKPDEIAALREELDRVAQEQGTSLNRAEYDSLAEKLDMAQRFSQAIDHLQKSQESIVKKLNDNFQAVADTGEVTEFRFSASLIANIVFVISLVTKVGGITNARLDRQLKQLQIVEKKAQLEKGGIDPNKF